MKLFRHKNFMGLIYSVLVAIPLLSILSRSAYVSLNKNAYQSYSGTTTSYQRVDTPVPTNEVNSNNDLHIDSYYHLRIDYLSQELSYENTKLFAKVDTINNYNITWYVDETSSADTTTFPYNNYYLFIDIESGETMQSLSIFVSDDDNATFNTIFDGSYTRYLYDYGVLADSSLQEDNFGLDIYCQLLEYDNLNQYAFLLFSPYQKTIITYNEVESSTLDNVFEYSIQSFVKDNDFGKLNFFQWFTSLFMNGNNNALYIGFINWYMNYILLVSCAYILFLVLMWFINFSRRILERGMNYDW